MQKPWHIEVDTHTHTVLSGHAWSTLKENCEEAQRKGLKGLCITEHAPKLEGTCPYFAPATANILPEKDLGIHLFMGSEMNIMDYDGHVDLTDAHTLRAVQFGIASMHNIVTMPGSKDENTAAYIGVLKNPHVDMIGHPGTPEFPCEIETVVLAAKKENKMIEINNNSFRSRPGCDQNCLSFAKYCKKHEVRICVSSDSHYYRSIGVFNDALAMLEEVDFPPELILNYKYDQFLAYVQEERKQRF